MIFHKTVLKNGIRVVTESHPSAKAAAFGIWLMQGTRDENPLEMGISHFLEHMVFKGTKKRSAFQIAKSLEALGGELNAYTTKENTCYHALVLKDHWYEALEVLCDLVSHMRIRPNDFRLEKSVILQEIAMSEDNPEDFAYEQYFQTNLATSSLSWPILGTPKTVASLTASKVNRYYRENYCGRRIIVSAAGNVSHAEIVEAVKKLLGHKKAGKALRPRPKPKHSPKRQVVERPTEQLHVLLGLPVPSFKSPLRFEAFIVNALLGGGMTSKLYQKVREKRGLAYSIYSSLHTFADFGMINIYAGCEPGKAGQILKTVKSEMQRLQGQAVSESELNLFKTQVKGSLLLGSDDMENRMSSIAVNEMIFQKYKPVEEIMDEIDAVTSQSLFEFSSRYLDSKKLGCILLGKDAKRHENLLKILSS